MRGKERRSERANGRRGDAGTRKLGDAETGRVVVAIASERTVEFNSASPRLLLASPHRPFASSPHPLIKTFRNVFQLRRAGELLERVKRPRANAFRASMSAGNSSSRR